MNDDFDIPEELRREIEEAVGLDAVLDWGKLRGIVFDLTLVAGQVARAAGNIPRLEALERATRQPDDTHGFRFVERDRIEVFMGDPPVHVCTVPLSALLSDEDEDPNP